MKHACLFCKKWVPKKYWENGSHGKKHGITALSLDEYSKRYIRPAMAGILNRRLDKIRGVDVEIHEQL
jgi:hypothetical protein